MKKIRRKKISTPISNERRGLRLVLFWLLIIVILVFSSLIVKVYVEYKNSPVRRFEKFWLVVYSSKGDTTLMSVNKNSILIYQVPLGISFKLAHGYGEYPANKIYDLGQIDGKGDALLFESWTQYLLLPFLGVIRNDLPIESDRLKKSIVNLVKQAVKNNNLYNISQLDGLLLGYRLDSFKPSSYQRDDFVTLIGQIDNFDMESWDKNITNQNLSVQIVNTTDKPGLGSRVAKYLEHNGFRIIRLEDGDTGLKDVCILNFQEGKSGQYSYRWLKQFLGCRDGKQLPTNSRSDIEAVIGIGYWQKLEEKW